MAERTGCFTIVVNKNHCVLMVKRTDYPLWDLPGGRLENGETLEECAVRETMEETGYLVAIQKKIGEYYQVQYEDTQHLFLAKVVGGTPIHNGLETKKVKWMKPTRLPFLMIPNRRKQIKNYTKNNEAFIQESLSMSTFMYTFLKHFLK